MSPILDKSIGIAIMLFVLSMISERFVTWIKVYYGKENRIFLLGLYNSKKRDLRSKASKVDEKSKESEVLGLNVVLSIILALLSNANFFLIFKSKDPFNAIGWEGYHFDFSCRGVWLFLSLLPGWALTGFFISLGSKFWHDTLDLLFYTKNLREKAGEKATYEVDSLKQLDEYLEFTQHDLARLAVEQNNDYLKSKFPNINFITDSVSSKGKEQYAVAGIYLLDDNIEDIPKQIPAKLPSGQVKYVDTKIIADVELGSVSAGLDGTVAGHESRNYLGSACCLAKDKKGEYLLLTNAHVITDGKKENVEEQTGDMKVYYEDKFIGKWKYGLMSPKGDFAEVLLEKPEAFMDDNAFEKFDNKFRTITEKDYNQLVYVRGHISSASGYIMEMAKNKISIRYDDNQRVTFEEAILLADSINTDNCKAVSTEGDSGGIVYDENKKIIGMITGKLGKKYSVVIPFSSIASKRSLTII